MIIWEISARSMFISEGCARRSNGSPVSPSLFSPSGEWATILPTRIKSGLSSFRWKVPAVYVLITAVAFGLAAFSLIRLVGDYLYSGQIRQDLHTVTEIADQCGGPLIGRDIDALLAFASENTEHEGTRFFLVDRSGVIQFDSASVAAGTKPELKDLVPVLSGEIRDAGSILNPGELTGFGMPAESEGSICVSVCAIIREEQVCGAAVYITDAGEIVHTLDEVRLRTIALLIVIAGVVLAAGLLISRSMMRPLTALSSGIDRMTKGDLSARVPVRGSDEFARLALAFNYMSERIEQLDRLRNQFVSNASHELKTPLATMKISLEALMYQDRPEPDVLKEFLGDMDHEIDRLNRIISDLLTLVRIDSEGTELRREKLRIGQIVQEQAQRLLPLAREGGIELRCAVHDPCESAGDADKLAQVFSNLIDNGIKYTPRGGSVVIDVRRSGRRAVITVSDTGVGIPKEDLEHIFDRFYRVDKARSRDTGGTGLGLSIVRQIVGLHGGEVRAQSTEGRGSLFTVELPILSAEEDPR